MNRLSMSGLSLAMQCLYGYREDVRTFPRDSGRAAQLGTLVHALVEECALGIPQSESEVERTATDLTMLAEAKAILNGPLRGFVEGRRWSLIEAGMRYDSHMATSVDGPRRGDPGYDDVPSHVLHGTFDLVCIESDRALVVDLKTGKPPSDAEQLYGQAVAVAHRYGLREVRVQYARALKTKLDILNDEVLDADALDAKAGRIARALRMLPTSEPKPGDWCWKCDARPGCPAHAPSDEYLPSDRPEPALLDERRMF